ncbi:TPA: hypothetical protein I7784_22665 [Vibrio vulnificus]|nr:hypothetical protein [Vibrio vulnificus]
MARRSRLLCEGPERYRRTSQCYIVIKGLMSKGKKPVQESAQVECSFGWPTNNNYWSSTASGTGKHDNVNLNNGNVNSNNDSNNNYVGCVRTVNAKSYFYVSRVTSQKQHAFYES